MKFGMYVEVDEWCTTVCSMTWSKVKVKVTSPWQWEILSFSKVISSAIFNGSWQRTTDSETRAQYLNFLQARFVIFFLVFVSRDFDLGRNISCEGSTVSHHTGLILVSWHCCPFFTVTHFHCFHWQIPLWARFKGSYSCANVDMYCDETHWLLILF